MREKVKINKWAVGLILCGAVVVAIGYAAPSQYTIYAGIGMMLLGVIVDVK